MNPLEYVNECLRQIEQEKTRLTELAEDNRRVTDHVRDEKSREIF